ncbi:MAG: glycosyltransferase family 4 protein [Acidimicrobiia bacterium]|nr:glycosyltransferase family 4 protein [Acidimicrobiia bacterium]
MKICMFVKNSFEYDARVTKEATTLIEAGHDVTVVAIHVPNKTAETETTPDGIRVVRVSRLSFGLGTLNRIAARYAGSIETRHARLTGEEVDEGRARELGQWMPTSTATPGDEVAVVVDTAAPATSSSALKRLWGRITTPVLRTVARIARFCFKAVRFLVGKQGRALKTWAINRRMIAVGMEQAASVYHSHDLNTLYIGAMCKKRTGARLVYDSHELQTERNRMTKWWRRWAAWNEKRWLPYADAMIVASPSWIEINRQKYGSVPDPSVTVINTPELEVISEPADLRGELDIAAETPVLLYQGSIQENRGIEPAIDAITLLEDAALVIVGYGYHRPALEAQVRERGLSDRVKFFGPIPNNELLRWTAAADIGLCNIVNSSLSYYTSLPNKLFEYIIAGIAVIGSDSPEIGRIVLEEGVGEVADPVDPEDLARAARSILADLDRYRRATRTAAQKYNWSNEEQKLLEVYATLG